MNLIFEENGNKIIGESKDWSSMKLNLGTQSTQLLIMYKCDKGGVIKL